MQPKTIFINVTIHIIINASLTQIYNDTQNAVIVIINKKYPISSRTNVFIEIIRLFFEYIIIKNN